MTSRTGQMARALEAAKEPEWAATGQLDRKIAESRERMGENRWKQCQLNWDNPDFDGGEIEG